MFWIIFIAAVLIMLYNLIGMIKQKMSMDKASSKCEQQKMMKKQKQDFETIEMTKRG